MATYYFDESDAGFTDPDAQWTTEVGAFDGSLSTNAFTAGAGTHYLKAEGTNAPASGDTIIMVEARLYGYAEDGGGPEDINASIYTDGEAELLGTASNVNTTYTWTPYTELSTPTGGWTWPVLQALEVKLFTGMNSAIGAAGAIYEVQIRVNGADPPGGFYLTQGYQ